MLPTLVQRLYDVVPGIDEAFEIVLVIDSPDNTWDVAAALAEKYEEVQAIRMARNYGQQNALIAGIRASTGDLIVTMDDDLQHPPEEIPKLVAALTDDLDVVYALADREEHNLFRNVTSRVAKGGMSFALGAQNANVLSAFRILRSFLRNSFDQVDGPHVSVDVALSWATTRVGTVTVRMDNRIEGKSGYSFKTLVKHALNMSMGYSTKPLRLVTYLGLFVGLCGFALALRVLWLYYRGETTVAGFTTIATMGALFSSAQMIGLGIVGEYVGRIHARGLGRPTYVIRERLGAPRRTFRTEAPPSERSDDNGLADPAPVQRSEARR